MTTQNFSNFDRLDLVEARWRIRDGSLFQVAPPGLYEKAHANSLNASQIIDYYLSRKGLSCCSFQVGFFINVNGEPWSDEGAVDEPWMTETLIQAVFEIDNSSEHASANAYPWEESQMKLWRDGNVLTMQDSPTKPRIKIDYNEFKKRMKEEATHLGELVDQVIDQAQRRRSRRKKSEQEQEQEQESKEENEEEFRLKMICDELSPLKLDNIKKHFE